MAGEVLAHEETLRDRYPSRFRHLDAKPVERELSRTEVTGGLSASMALRGLNTQRRIRRMRSVVIASAKAAKQHLDASGDGYWNPFVLLTYGSDQAWRPEHISEYLRLVKRYCARCKVECRYEWVVELQPCGRPHYHVLFWLPYGFMLPKPDQSGMWPHGFSGVQAARNAVGYIVKYATKGNNELHELPKHCRLFGVGGGGPHERLVTHRAGLPIWLRELLTDRSRARKVSFVGWVDSETHQVFRSPFVVSWCKDEWGIVVVTISRKELVV